MKNILIVLLLLIALALAGLCFQQRTQLTGIKAQISSLQSQLHAAETQVKESSAAVEDATIAETKARILQDTLKQTSSAAVENTKKVEALEQSLAAAQTNSAGAGLAGLLNDPKMKEMIKAQQKLFMGPMIDKMYGAAFEQLKLTPDQTTALKELIEKKMSAGSEMGLSMMDPGTDAAKRKELVEQMKKETESTEEQIKELLGAGNYETFKTYEKSVSDRVAVSQFRDQLAGKATALSSGQEEQLIQAMQEARTAFPWTTDYNQAQGANPDFDHLFDENRVNKFAEEKEKFDRQFLDRASQILTAEQLAAFEKIQSDQRKMQVAAMQMAAKMMGGKRP